MANKTASKKKKKKGMSIGFIMTLVVVFGLPIGGLLVWYFTTAALSVSGSKLSAGEMVVENLAKVQGSMLDEMNERAKKEAFSLKRVDACKIMASEYYLPETIQINDALDREIVGLSKRATEEALIERCILYAKIVNRMEKLSHHHRHIVMCGGAEFTSDESGRFKILADPEGRGLIESFSGLTKLVEIPKGSHKLIRQWQVFNIGDGCIVVGISNSGTFSLAQK